MNPRILVVALVLCLTLALGVLLTSDDAYAQTGANSKAKSAGKVAADKTSAAKETGTLGNKEWDQNKLPGKLQVGLGIGSIFVMIAVVKWL